MLYTIFCIFCAFVFMCISVYVSADHLANKLINFIYCTGWPKKLAHFFVCLNFVK